MPRNPSVEEFYDSGRPSGEIRGLAKLPVAGITRVIIGVTRRNLRPDSPRTSSTSALKKPAAHRESASPNPVSSTSRSRRLVDFTTVDQDVQSEAC
jgi:hypothetical protein